MKLRIGLLLLLPAALFGQLSPELTSSYWQDPDFRDRFMQTYGTRGEIEPKVNQEEAAILQQIMPQLEASNYRLAINTLQAQITPQSSAALDMVLGNLYFQEGNVSAARQAYREAIRKFPNFLRAHQNLGILEVQNGNFETAIPLLSKTIEMGIADGDTYGLLAYSFLNQGQYGSAESAYRQALLLDPNNPDWKNGLINALLENSKPGEAIAIIEEVIAKDPSKPEFWMVQANAYLAMDDRQKAIANLEMVRRLGKADAQSLMLLGDLYMSGEMADLALTVYKEAIEQDGEITADKAMRSAEVLLSQANYDEALEYIETVEANYPELEDEQELKLLSMKSEAYLATDRTDEAAEMLRQVVARDPLNGKANMLLGDYEWDQGNIEKARTYYEDAASTDDYAVRARLNHVQMMVSEGRFAEAAELMREVTAREPNNDRYQAYLDQIEQRAEVERLRSS